MKQAAALARLRKSFGGGILGGTSLAPSGKPPVPGQFDDASPSTSVTTYDKLGRPNLAGIGRSSAGGDEGGGGGAAGGGGESSASGRDKEGRDGAGGDTGRDWDRNRCACMLVSAVRVFFHMGECVRVCIYGWSVCISRVCFMNVCSVYLPKCGGVSSGVPSFRACVCSERV